MMWLVGALLACIVIPLAIVWWLSSRGEPAEQRPGWKRRRTWRKGSD